MRINHITAYAVKPVIASIVAAACLGAVAVPTLTSTDARTTGVAAVAATSTTTISAGSKIIPDDSPWP